MSPTVKRIIAQAVVSYLDGNYAMFRSWTDKAMEVYKQEVEKNRLHASIEEILRYKGIHLERGVI